MQRTLTLVIGLGLIGCGESPEPAVHSFTPSANPLLTNGRPADGVVGQLSFTAEDLGTTTANGISGPQAIASAAQDSGMVEIWVADTANNRVLGWLADSAFSTDISNGDSADIVLGQVSFLRSDGLGDPPNTFTPLDVEVVGDTDQTRQLFVLTSLNEVLVYDDPFLNDSFPEYSLEGLPVGTVKIAGLRNGLVAAHSTSQIGFYQQGNPARIRRRTDPLNPNTDGLLEPGGCDGPTIVGVASTDNLLFVACERGTIDCATYNPAPTMPQMNCVTTADANPGSMDITGQACSPAGPCGVLRAFTYELPDDPSDDADPNRNTGLPVFNDDPPIFSGFGFIRDIEARGNALYVADSRNRVLRLPDADTAARAILNILPAIDPRQTQNVWANAISTGTDPDADQAYGQESVTQFVQNRGRDPVLRLSASSLVDAIDISLDPSGVYAIDSAASRERVLRYAENENTASLVLGQPNFQFDRPNRIEGTGFAASISVALHHASNTLYVVDRDAHRVMQFDAGSLMPTGMQATNALGQTPGLTNLLEYLPNRGGSANASTLSTPDAVAVDQVTGDVHVRDRGNTRVVRFSDPSITETPTGAVIGDTEVSGINGAIAFFDGRVFVSNGREIRRYASGDDDQRRYGDLNVPAGAAGTAPGPAAFGGAIGGIAFDETVTGGAMYVSDTAKNRILRFDRPVDDTNQLEAITADFVIGQINFQSDTAGTSRDTLRGPRGLAVDNQGRLWVADSGNQRVLMFANPRTLNADGRVDASFILGQSDFTTRTRRLNSLGQADAETLSNPVAIATNQDGTVVYVADVQDNRVLRFTDAQRLAFTAGPGVYEVAQGQTRTVNISTTVETATLTQGASTQETASLQGSAVVFDSTGLPVGTQARVEVVASLAGPPAQSIQGAVTFKVIQGVTESTATPPGSRQPRAREDSGCTCNGIQAPWLAALGIFALLRRRRRG